MAQPSGGLKVITLNQGWFAARPSGTEEVYKLYAESFRGSAHLATHSGRSASDSGRELSPERSESNDKDKSKNGF